MVTSTYKVFYSCCFDSFWNRYFFTLIHLYWIILLRYAYASGLSMFSFIKKVTHAKYVVSIMLICSDSFSLSRNVMTKIWSLFNLTFIYDAFIRLRDQKLKLTMGHLLLMHYALLKQYDLCIYNLSHDFTCLLSSFVCFLSSLTKMHDEIFSWDTCPTAFLLKISCVILEICNKCCNIAH